ncbi:MAG: Hsp20/alpha crystallin family protein [Gemmataceae bacterium]|nr:Hsp20/alpha crystallin family protein [Gemmataceae bacterium]
MAETQAMVQKDRSEVHTAERTRGGVTFTPRVDIYETDTKLVLCADMPGVRPQDIDLRYERGELVLHGRVEPRQRVGAFLLNEYEDGDFYRVFTISESIDASRIEAECKHGVLTIHLPKVAAVQPKQINVKAN